MGVLIFAVGDALTGRPLAIAEPPRNSGTGEISDETICLISRQVIRALGCHWYGILVILLLVTFFVIFVIDTAA